MSSQINITIDYAINLNNSYTQNTRKINPHIKKDFTDLKKKRQQLNDKL